MILKYTKIGNDNFRTLRQVLDNKFRISYILRLKLKRSKQIFVNGNNTYLDYELKPNDVVTVNLDFEEEAENIVPTKMNLDIIYEDECFIILNKPAGISTHPTMRHFSDTLANGLKFYFDSINFKRKIRPVNRLDINTSGLVIFAKNEYVHSILSRQMQEGIFRKEYIAICEGLFVNNVGTINAPIGRKNGSIIERTVASDGQKAITNYTVINKFKNYTELLINLETGRTHQIRVHMAYIGHPILGDTLYGHESHLISRQALHSYKVSFLHPIKNQKVEFVAPLPEDMKLVI